MKQKLLLLLFLTGCWEMQAGAQDVRFFEVFTPFNQMAPMNTDTVFTVDQSNAVRRVTPISSQVIPVQLPTGTSVRDMLFLNQALWFATDSGVVRSTNGQTDVWSTARGNFVSNDIRQLLAYNNQLAVLTSAGISLFSGTSWTHFNSTTPGFPAVLPSRISASANAISFVSGNRVYALQTSGITSFAHGLADTLELAVQNNQGFYFLLSKRRLYQRNLAGVTDTIFERFGIQLDLLLMGNKRDFVAYSGGYYAHFNGQRWTFRFGTFSRVPAGQATHLHLVGSDKIMLRSQEFIFIIERPDFIGTINSEERSWLDINQVEALFHANGNMFWDQGLTGVSEYHVPKRVNKAQRSPELSHAAGWWIGGKSNGELFQTAQMFSEITSGGRQFESGILNSQGQPANERSLRRIWKINRKEIADFNWAWSQGLVQNGSYVPSFEFITWPGTRPGSTDVLAPFFDRNNDGAYNYLDGDHPLIKGDQALWWVMHDLPPQKFWPGLGLELQCMAYAFTCEKTIQPIDSVVNYTVFLDTRFVNRSNRTYDSTLISFFHDYELGGFRGSLLGTDVKGNGMYTYSRFEADTFPGGHGFSPPAMGTYWLQGPVADANDGIDNNFNGVVDEPGERISMSYSSYFFNSPDTQRGNPVSAEMSRNYSLARWRNGSPIVYGGSGQPGTTGTLPQAANFVFPGTSDSLGRTLGGTASGPVLLPSLWGTNGSVSSLDLNLPPPQNDFYDIRMVSGAGFFQLAPGASKEVSLAFIYSRGAGNNLSSVTKLLQNDAPRVRHWFNQAQYPSCLDLSTVSVKESSEALKLHAYPNPATNTLFVETNNEQPLHLRMTDLQGRLVLHVELAGQTNYRIDLPAAAPGIYLLRWEQNGFVKMEKLVKQ